MKIGPPTDDDEYKLLEKTFKMYRKKTSKSKLTSLSPIESENQ